MFYQFFDLGFEGDAMKWVVLLGRHRYPYSYNSRVIEASRYHTQDNNML